MVDEDLEFVEEVEVPLSAVEKLDQNVLARKNTTKSLRVTFLFAIDLFFQVGHHPFYTSF